MKIYNTITRKKEEFKPITPGKVLFYHCGPTVYWTQHIGNLRAVACADSIVRSLRYLGFSVRHVRNYTDVGHLTSDADSGEDKMEKGVKREGLSPKEIADKYISIYEKDIDQLNTIRPSFSPRATEYVQEMQQMIAVLLEKGFAYKAGLAVYFDVSKFNHYTDLSHQKLSEMMSGEGKGDVTDSEKKNAADFALWFFKKGAHANALQTWVSPWGEGFPGWHIECSAMSKALLGPTIDLHMGGVEHIPVHHTNEIAQSEAANGVKFVHYWVHNEHLVVDDSKMAKSEGTSYSLQDVADKGFDPLVLRYFYLQAHYRSKQNFTWEASIASQNALEKLQGEVNILSREVHFDLSGRVIQKWNNRFINALSDDFNVPQALSILWDMKSARENPIDALATILKFDEVLGLKLSSYAISIEKSNPEVNNMLIDLDRLRKEKKFAEADTVRDNINKKGFKVNTTSNGSVALPWNETTMRKNE